MQILGILATPREMSASLGRVWWEALGEQWPGIVNYKSDKGCTVRYRVQMWTN